jgi:hypothetical protein
MNFIFAFKNLIVNIILKERKYKRTEEESKKNGDTLFLRYAGTIMILMGNKSSNTPALSTMSQSSYHDANNSENSQYEQSSRTLTSLVTNTRKLH